MQRLRDLAISDTGFVFDPYSGATFTANGSALVILDCLKRGLGRIDTAAALWARFDVRGDDVPRDIDDVLQTLRLFGLLPTDCEVL